MGDRGNIVMVQNNGDNDPIYFYSHSGAGYLKDVLKKALKRKLRWDDETYLARIIFCEMLKTDYEDALNGEVGFGISSYLTDNQHDLLVVNCSDQTVGYAKDCSDITKLTRKKSFADFIK